MCLVSAMSSGRPAYEPAVWLLLVEWIGSSLRKRYRPPEELPPGWLTRLPLATKLEIPVRDIKGEDPDLIRTGICRVCHSRPGASRRLGGGHPQVFDLSPSLRVRPRAVFHKFLCNPLSRTDPIAI